MSPTLPIDESLTSPYPQIRPLCRTSGPSVIGVPAKQGESNLSETWNRRHESQPDCQGFFAGVEFCDAIEKSHLSSTTFNQLGDTDTPIGLPRRATQTRLGRSSGNAHDERRNSPRFFASLSNHVSRGHLMVMMIGAGSFLDHLDFQVYAIVACTGTANIWTSEQCAISCPILLSPPTPEMRIALHAEQAMPSGWLGSSGPRWPGPGQRVFAR
jgi:hypothetical protein